jgi:uncharacterized membrane protein
MSHSDIRNLKLRARGLLDGRHAFFAAVTVSTLALNMLLASVVEYAITGTGFTSQLLYLVCSVLTNMVYYLFLAGVFRVYLKTGRGQQIRMSELFFAFSAHPESLALYSVLQFALQTLATAGGSWCLSRIFLGNDLKSAVSIVIAAILVFCLLLYAELGLCLVLFVYADDPYQSTRELIRKSWHLTRGHKRSLLWLYLSFAGMMILAVLSFGIGFLFVRPYLYMTLCLFYLYVCRDRSNS